MADAKGRLPRMENGDLDKDQIKILFMASPFIDWTRFAQEWGEETSLSRRQLPVRTWQVEKRNKIAEEQLDILSSRMHERKFQWTADVLDTLDTYPKAIDTAMTIAQAKMSQIADMYNDYVEFKTKPRPTINGRPQRHEFEKLSTIEISALMRGMQSITEAKLKALMIDKWAIKKLDIPHEEINEAEKTVEPAPMLTVEGQEAASFDDLQKWFDMYHDKPMLAEAIIPNQNEASTSKAKQNGES